MTAPLLHLFSLEELIASFESTAAPGCKPPPCEGLPQTSVSAGKTVSLHAARRVQRDGLTPARAPPPRASDSQVQHLALDPKDPSRLAFQLGAASRTPPLVGGPLCATGYTAHLLMARALSAAPAPPTAAGCGWLGVLDVNELSVTHLHCPEPATDGMVSGVVCAARQCSWASAWSLALT